MCVSPDGGDGDGAAQDRRRFGSAWLLLLLRLTFWVPCPEHPELTRNECNHFCLDCPARPLCWLCLLGHRQHRIIQIRRSSYHNVVRVTEMEAVADISLVQTYSLNFDRVVFLNPRPQAPKHAVKCVGAAGACQPCGRGLVDASFRFCSLACKLANVELDTSLTMSIDPKRRRRHDDGAGDDGGGGEAPPPNKFQRPGQTSYRKRSRKGSPHRAPFF